MLSEQTIGTPARQARIAPARASRPSAAKAARDLIDRTTRRFPGLYQNAYHLLAMEMTPEIHAGLVERLIGWSRTDGTWASPKRP